MRPSLIVSIVMYVGFIASCMSPAFVEAHDNDEHAIEDPGERAAIEEAAGLALRKGPSLILLTGAGPAKFEDGHGPYCSDANCGYSLIQHIAGRGFLLIEGFGNSDGGRFFWVNETIGRTTDLEDRPIFSPDGRHFAIISTCDGMGKCVLQVWKSDGPKLLFERRPTNFEDFNFKSWDGNDRVLFEIGVFAADHNAGLHYSSGTITQHKADDWRFESDQK